MKPLRRAKAVIDLEIEGLQAVRNQLDRRFNQAVSLILTALTTGHKIVVTGVGKNLHIGEKISATLASTGATCVFLNPIQAMHGDLGIVAANDILLALSYSGESREILDLIPVVRRIGVKIISFCGGSNTALGRCSDVVIDVTVPREACPFNLAPTTSTTATLAIGDALAMALLDERGFRKEDYAKLHPGGAIGRTLLYRVSDIMRTGERVAVVPLSATVKDAILAMTQARSGSAAVTDRKGLLKGIFTDGDLRRHLPNTPHLLDQPVKSVMTAAPLSITADRLAVDVLHVFETHKIDDLPVVDAQGHLVGAIDIQDLPRLKIV